MCGDESIVPHKGLFLFRQFIPRKPHTTGVKLYLLCDAQDRYIWHVYLYHGAMPRDNPPPPATYAGHYTPVEIVQMWHDVAPKDRVLVADTYFGSYGTASSLAARSRPFLMLIPKSADLAEQGSRGLQLGKANTVVHKEDGYALSIFKSPKVGKKAALLCPWSPYATMARMYGGSVGIAYSALWPTTAHLHQALMCATSCACSIGSSACSQSGGRPSTACCCAWHPPMRSPRAKR